MIKQNNSKEKALLRLRPQQNFQKRLISMDKYVSSNNEFIISNLRAVVNRF